MASTPHRDFLQWAGVWLLAAVLAGGCASTPSRGLRLEPRPEPASVAPPLRPDAATLEEHDLDLRVLLLSLAESPTAENHRRVAEAYADRHVLDAAYGHYAAALELAPRDWASLDGLARVWRDWGFQGLAITQAYRAVFQAPDAAGARNTLGSILLRLGLPDEARAAFDRVLELEPGATYALNNLCYVHLLQGRSRDAIDICREALAAQPNLTAARNNLALAYAVSGDIASASRAFAETGGAGAVSYNMGMAYMAVGDYTSAARAFDRAAMLRPLLTNAATRAAMARRMAARGPLAGPDAR